MIVNGKHFYKEVFEVIRDRECGIVADQTDIKFWYNNEWSDTTVGRVKIFDICGILIDFALDKSGVKKLYCKINEDYEPEVAAKIMTKLQALFFKSATESGISLCMEDFSKPEKYREVLSEAYTEALNHEGMDRAKVWDDAINGLVEDWKINSHGSSLHVMMQSGARVTDTQVRQMIVAKGLLTNMSGGLNVDAIYNSLGDGLGSTEYFNTCGPARRGLANNFFLVPASGYLERQLVNSTRDLTITTDDCGSKEGMNIPKAQSRGRYMMDGTLITKSMIQYLPDYVLVRSPTTCTHDKGLCKKCCGVNPANSKDWWINAGIGVMAAQTACESFTQLALRGKHTSGSVTLKSYSNKIDTAIADVLKLFGAAGTTAVKVGSSEMPAPSEVQGDLYIDRASALVDHIMSVFHRNSTPINRMYVEVIVRSMSDLVKLPNGDSHLRSRGYHDDNPAIRGVSQALRQHPSWMKGIEFGYTGQVLVKGVSNMSESLDLPSELLLEGRLV